MKRIFTILFLSVLISITGQAQDLSSRLLFSARLNGNNNTNVVNPGAKGIGVFHLNTTRDTLHINVNVAGLGSDIAQANIHAGAAGVDGPVVLSIDSVYKFNTLRVALTDTLLDSLLNMMIDEELYLNVLAEGAPASGTARGQIKLERDFSFYCNLDTNQTVPLITGSLGQGSANFRLDQTEDSLSVKIVTEALQGDIIEAILYRGKPGEIGHPIISLTSEVFRGSAVNAVVAVPDSIVGKLRAYVEAGEVYTNITTALFPGGEVRGVAQFSNDIYFDVYAAQDELLVQPPFGATAKLAGHAYLNSTLDTLRYFMVYEKDSIGSAILSTSFLVNGLPGKTITADSGRIAGVWTATDGTQPLNAAAIDAFFTNTAGVQILATFSPAGEVQGTFGRGFRDGYAFEMDTTQVVEEVVTTELPLGGGMVSINTRGTNAHYMLAWDNLSGNPTNVSLNKGVSGASGPELFQLAAVGGGAFGYLTATSGFTNATTALFNADSVYVNVATSANPDGELRAYLNKNYAISVGVSENNIEISSLNLFPNPTADVLNLALNTTVNATLEIRIFSIDGVLLVSESLQATAGQTNHSVNVSHLQSGNYVLNIGNGAVNSSKIWIKK